MLDDLLPEMQDKGDRVLIFSQVQAVSYWGKAILTVSKVKQIFSRNLFDLTQICNLTAQFTMLMDVMERYLKLRGHRYLRLDGQTPVQVLAAPTVHIVQFRY